MRDDDPRANLRADEPNPYRSFDDPDSPQAPAPDPFGARPGGALDGVGPHEATRGARRFSVLAVAVGYGSDYLVTEVVDRLYWQVVVERIVSGSGSMPNETTSLLAISLLGTASSVLGGFVCGRIAKHAEVKHGVAQLLLGFAIFLGQVWSSGGWGLPSWYYALTIPAVSLATVAGAWLAGQRRLRRARASGS
ncbi:MAG: hypothetical protein IPK07_23040 [Deltaproteobacteria bacterium]|nr:hypothetical protein [Deltaproteobacteria bacterium]